MSVLSMSLGFLKKFFPEILSWIGITSLITFIYLNLMTKNDLFGFVVIIAVHLFLLTSMMLHLGSLAQRQPISYLKSIALAFKKGSDTILVFVSFFMITAVITVAAILLTSLFIPANMLWIKWGINAVFSSVSLIIFLMFNAILVQVVVFHGGGYQASIHYCIRLVKRNWGYLLQQLAILGLILFAILAVDTAILYSLFPEAKDLKLLTVSPALSLISLVLIKFTTLPLVYPFLLFLYIKLHPAKPSE